MQFRMFAMEKKYPSAGFVVSEKKLGWWKVVVVVVVNTVAVIATGLLIAIFLLGSASSESNSSSESDDGVPLSILNIGRTASKETVSVVSQRALLMSKVYCSIRNCVVTCSGIPAASSPGIVAAVFMDSEYETLCPNEELVEELIFDNCRFLNRQLSLGWLPTKFQLYKLTLKRCDLAVIDSDALNTRQFFKLRSLAMIDNAISVFKKSLFDTLSNLEELVITDNVIEAAEIDLLKGTANSLQVLQIDKAIYSENILENIVGSSSLPRVILLSLRENLLKQISAETFKGVPNVQSVYLSNSGISLIEPNAFNHFSGSIHQIFLNGNKLSHLPSTIFQSIIQSNPKFKVTLADNDWNCQCDLKWLQIATSIIADRPQCTNPERNAALDFSAAHFCQKEFEITKEPSGADFDGNATGTALPNNQTDEKTEADDERFTLACDEIEKPPRTFGRKLLSVKELKFPAEINSFSIREETNGTIYVSLPMSHRPYTLMWFHYSDKKNESMNFQNVSCLTNVKKSVYLTQLKPGVPYTICLLDMHVGLMSPFNCLSFKRASFDSDETGWFKSEDQLTFYCGLVGLLVLVCVVSVLGAYVVVWRNPTLLRGSKRIIMVRHRAADAIILPEGVELKSGKDDPKHEDYVTPMSQRRLLTRKSSDISRASSRCSSTSYVSGIQPTTTQLMSWRIGRLREILSCSVHEICDNPPPPIPPPRNESIPSVSFKVDEKRGFHDYRNPMATLVTSCDNHLCEEYLSN